MKDIIMEHMAMLSFTTPIYEPTKISYIRNASDTGMEIILVRVGFLSQRETVTKTEAVMGSRSIWESIVRSPRVRLTAIKRRGHKRWFAHFFSSRFTKTSSLPIPTRFGTTPPKAERHR